MKILSLVALFIISLNSFSQVNSLFDPTIREGKSEIYFGFMSNASFDLKGSQGGELNARSGFGGIVEGGYNLSKRLYFGMLFSMHKQNYQSNVIVDNTGTITEDQFLSDLLFTSIEFTTRFNLFPTAFTPYLEGSLGMTHINSGVPSGQPVTGCYWDPYTDKEVCNDIYSNATKISFSYSVAAGLHYEITSRANIQLSGRYRFIQTGFNDDFPDQFSFGLSIGYIIP